MSPELDEVRKTLRQVFQLHLNGGRNGHTMGFKIIDAGGKTVGYKSIHTTKKPPKTIVVYMHGDQEFDNAEAFLTAYQQTLRDQEWDAAAPADEQKRIPTDG